MAESLEARVAAALARIQNPRLENDLLSGGMIRDLAVTPDGGGQLHLPPGAGRSRPRWCARPGRPSRRSRGSAGTAVKIAVTNPSGPPRSPTGRRPETKAPRRRHRRTRDAQSRPDHRHLVGQGRGGKVHRLGQSRRGARRRRGAGSGLMDADVYGPNIPRMFGVSERPPVMGGKIQPLEAHGVRLMSLGFWWSGTPRRSGAARSS